MFRMGVRGVEGLEQMGDLEEFGWIWGWGKSFQGCWGFAGWLVLGDFGGRGVGRVGRFWKGFGRVFEGIWLVRGKAVGVPPSSPPHRILHFNALAPKWEKIHSPPPSSKIRFLQRKFEFVG